MLDRNQLVRRRTQKIGLCAILWWGFTANAADLWGTYQMALESDPRLKQAAAVLRAVEQSYPQVRAGLLPQVDIVGRIDDTNQEGSRIGLLSDGAIGVRDITIDSDGELYSLELRQSIIDRSTWLQLGRTKEVIAAEAYRYAAAVQDLMLEVAIRYFEVLAADDRLAAAVAARDAVSRQQRQAENMRSVGLVAGTDVKEAQAAYDRSVADVIAAERERALASERLRLLTAAAPAQLAGTSESITLSPPDPPQVNEWIQRALSTNPRVAVRHSELQAARTDVDIARAQRWPVLDLVVSRSVVDRRSTNVFETLDIDEDMIGLEFRLPVFSGGLIRARVREAVELRSGVEAALEFEQRLVEQEVRDAYLGVISQIARAEAVEKAVQSAKAAFDATEDGFRVGTRTTVEVLDARRNLLAAEVALARSRYDYLLEGLRLQAVAGTLDEPALLEVNSFLQ